jgi:hypothetical protein
MGKVKASSNKTDEAFKNYQQVLALKDQLQKPDVEAEALFNLGHLYTIGESTMKRWIITSRRWQSDGRLMIKKTRLYR